MVRLWPSAPKITSSWAMRPGSRTEWMRTPPGPSPPRAPGRTSSVVGSGGQRRRAGPCPGGGDPRRGLAGRPRGSVPLGVVMELDHLDAVHVGCGQLAEAHEEHGTDGEVRRPPPRWPAESAKSWAAASSSASLRPGRAHDGMDALPGVDGQIGAHGVGHAEVDDHLGALLGAGRPRRRPRSAPRCAVPRDRGPPRRRARGRVRAATARQTSRPIRPPAPTTPTLRMV